MRIIGFPLDSFIYEFVIPACIVGWMFWYCWQVAKGKIS